MRKIINGADYRTFNTNRIARAARCMLVLVLAATMIFSGCISASAASGKSSGAKSTSSSSKSVSAKNATGRVNATAGAYLRSRATTSSRQLMLVKDNKKVTILNEVFVSGTSTRAEDRWFHVKVAGRKGYIRSDLIDNIRYKTVKAYAAEALNYRSGPGTKMTRRGVYSKGTALKVVLKASRTGNSSKWLKVRDGYAYYFVRADYVKPGKAPTASTGSGNSKDGSNSKAANSSGSPAGSGSTTGSSGSKSSDDSSGQKTAAGDAQDSSKSASAGTAVNDTQTASQNSSSSAGATGTTSTSGSDDQSAGAVTPALPDKLKATLAEVTYPDKIGKGLPFDLRGTITANMPIDRVRAGVVNSSGKWVIAVDKEGGDVTFNITSVDTSIRFGTLPAGTYRYRVTIYSGNKSLRVINKKFTVFRTTGDKILADTAVKIAWPVGTSKSKFSYRGGKATSAFNAAIDYAFPTHKKWGHATGTGASCDVFISTVCRYCGYDKNMPSGLQGQWKYLPKSSKWKQVRYTYKESDLQPGDIITYKRSNGQGHVCMYVKINGKGYLAEAAYKSKYGSINTSLRKVLRPAKNVIWLKVYRPTA